MVKPHRKFRSIILFICLALVFVFPILTPGADQRRPFDIPQHGTLILTIPSSWEQKVSPPIDQFPKINFYPAKGDDFRVLIAPLWSPTKDPYFNQSERIKNLIEIDLTGMRSQALEKEIDIHPLKGVYGTGYYFLLTDKAPKSGEYKYLLRAGVGVGDLLLSVTVLARTKDSEGIASTIKALLEARQEYDQN